MTIIWSPTSLDSYEEIIDEIIDIWNYNIVLRFSKSVDSLLEKLENNKSICPKLNGDKTIRKCIISKHNSLLYQIHADHIELLLFIKNKTDHNYYD